MAVVTRTTLVTIAVAGPVHFDPPYRWEVDGPGGRRQGHAATEAEAWTAARNAAVTVLGRLEVPGGGAQLRAALGGEP